MADTDGREPGDLERARRLGEALGEQLYRERPPPARLFQSVLDQVGAERPRRFEGRPLAGPAAQIDFFEDLLRVGRLIEYSNGMGLGGILVFTRLENDFGKPPPIDFLNPRTRRAFLNGRPNFPDLRDTVRAIEGIQGVATLDSREALIGFMTLFTDSVRVSALAASTGTTYVDYTVTSQNDGYQLEYYPQYNYSPQTFGAALTSPVTENIKTGHYHFQAYDSANTLHTESRTHFAGKHKTATVIRAF